MMPVDGRRASSPSKPAKRYVWDRIRWRGGKKKQKKPRAKSGEKPENLAEKKRNKRGGPAMSGCKPLGRGSRPKQEKKLKKKEKKSRSSPNPKQKGKKRKRETITCGTQGSQEKPPNKNQAEAP